MNTGSQQPHPSFKSATGEHGKEAAASRERRRRVERIIINMAISTEVKLLGVRASPFSWRVDLALKLKGVQYETIVEDLSNKSELLLKSNPVHKKIPVLIHNGKPIAESLVIVEYIDEAWRQGCSILPRDPHERAQARFWAKFIDDKCLPAIFDVMKSGGSDIAHAKMTEAEEQLRILDNEVKGKRFFGGDSIGLADIAGNVIAFWLDVFQELKGIELWSESKFPSLWKWKEEFLRNDIVRSSLPPRDWLLERLKARFGGSGAAASK